ncbi:tautomerase family protein [Marinobacter xestospongiae]|uniref:Tautomerase family protein n=1 Tax=Marinobacter xestospongiae TaxID=994319 RepID=A0ABU3W369_9GAMM|nr:tautomerase family protein [Marinobacter xestospongiae]MDV2080985.1 tautomerase family protein [Marinobacter xestospongiae]
MQLDNNITHSRQVVNAQAHQVGCCGDSLGRAGRPRSTDPKRALYQGLAKQLNDDLGLSPDDVMVVIQFTASEDWSFGGGRMFELASLPGASW